MTEANAIGGLTVEDVNAIQDEMNKIGEDDGSDAAAAEAKAAEDAKLAEAKAAEDKAKADADAKVGDDGKAKENDKGDDVVEGCLQNSVRSLGNYGLIGVYGMFRCIIKN